MTAKDIILAIEDHYGLSSNALAKELGVNHTRIDNLVNGVTHTITKSTADLLLLHFPSLNPDYVIKGHLPMLLHDKNKDFTRLSTAERMELIMQQYQLSTTEVAKRIGWRSSVISAIRIGTQYKQFSVAKVKDICTAFPELDANWLLVGYGRMFADGRAIDHSLPMPAPVRVNKKKGGTAKKEILPAPTVTPQPSNDTQAQINAAILEELKRLHEEIAELRNDRASALVADSPFKD